MIKRNTVLVLGAGASMPYGFPSGGRLKAEILNDLNNDREPFIRHSFPEGLVIEFYKRFARSGQSSIDAWLGRSGHEDYLEIGKWAIAKRLLGYEKTTALFDKINLSYLKTVQQSWYHKLYNALDAPFDEFDQNQLSVVTFNYDRSFEHFLHTALKNDNCGRSGDEVAEKARSIEVVHVHGQLGYLPWQNRGGVVPFDSEAEQKHINEAAKHIKIIHEASDEDGEFERARALLIEAEMAIILGFGFHPENLTRLGLKNLKDRRSKEGKRNLTIWGTSLGLANQDKHVGHEHFHKLLPRLDDRFKNKTVYQLLHDHVVLQ
ncbi:hypothetical protein STSP2_02863 [Anaerohalosphaera lusitana]|uniref:SIR2-like domain-containing protein n=1 Tax=Anaerohalosphaera lusitana TaxID=1936003 RepID=A0A1U9NP39_9BACT|nr:hypothetical protein [Anaerohalosphaera lusitana]AQT69669.1 hypothetical protein STSP2_02863 [Anaerohalosphaera lusitana]